ncbi:CRTAC1 family protein [Algibacillus agarilyticus]|uniref:CRTAC1 family protein n=1 Tax=Algibacillus agarilyticus TaxID=2234133 RepID=UPI000DCF8309|nr:CRTAC1 family protein [Algibacillus agarilyticus]
MRNLYYYLIHCLILLLVCACSSSYKPIAQNLVVAPTQSTEIEYHVEGNLNKLITFELTNPQDYASISLSADNDIILDNLDIQSSGDHTLTALVKFTKLGKTQLALSSLNAELSIDSFTIADATHIEIPNYQDVSVKAGLDKVSSIKYGGPTIADLDNDGDYDFIVNNHNAETSKLYWNNGDGTVRKHNKDLARWFMHDLHGVSAGDYDHDGDLDLIITQGGGNGKNPSTANFYHNNNGKLVLMTGDVNIDRGGRGRGGFWTDMDLDGDLDLLLINETSLHGDKPQHFAYENLGENGFKFRHIDGLLNQHPSRAVITDLNNDQIDDIILYGPLSVWQGNGDFTYTEITAQFPSEVTKLGGIMAVADVDIDNDGDLDLYLARGKEFENGRGEAPNVDFEPTKQIFSIKPRGFKGKDAFSFTAPAAVKLYNYYYLTQGDFRGQDYPLFLGKNKQAHNVQSGETFTLQPQAALGWPQDISENGVYFGYLGNNQWKAVLVRNSNIFWNYKFSLAGVNTAKLDFAPENRNLADVLLRNDNGKFVDVSKQWNIPQGGNSLGVTVGDFNNDTLQDIFVYRWGLIHARGSDLMLLNSGNQQFMATTAHGASDKTGPGNGDMGQAFDFDLDGDLDLLSGSEGGEWYLYQNQTVATNTAINTVKSTVKSTVTSATANAPKQGNYALIRVSYSPKANIDAISATVKIKVGNKTYQKRVGSAGSVFSQSLLNIVHFGLADNTVIDEMTVTWRNGETVSFNHQAANQIINAGIQLQPADRQANQTTQAGYVAPYVKILNRDEFENQPLKVGDSFTLNVAYHAGTGNKVIKSDQGGVRFWFRHFKNQWIPIKDTVLIDKSVVGTESGETKMTFKLTDLKATSALPEKQLYQFRVSFASSNGDMLNEVIYPLNLIE